MQLALGPAYESQRLAKIHLRMAGFMRKRYEYFLRPALLLTDVIRDDRQLAGEPMFVAKSLKYPLRRVTLLLDNPLIVSQNLIDDPDKTVELWPRRRPRPLITWWYRVLQDLRYCLPIDPEMSSSRSFAHIVNMARTSHPSIQIHRIHLPAFSSLHLA